MTTLVYVPGPHSSKLWEELADELDRAMSKFAPMNGPHEGWAVILEEVDELWEYVRGNTGRSPEARNEALQIAAMALRYICDVSEP